MERSTLIQQQAEVVDKLQRYVLDDSVDYDPDAMRCLTLAVDKYATLANPMTWPAK